MKELLRTIKGIQHIGIPTRDLNATARFFGGLGFSETYGTALEDGAHVVFLRLGDVVIEAYQADHVADSPGAIEHIALDVGDVEAVFDEACQLGYRPLEGEIKTLPFFERGVRFFTIEGPNKEKIEFNQKL